MKVTLGAIGSHDRHRFTGIFVRYGWKSGWGNKPAETVLLKNICTDSGRQVADHIWLNKSSWFEDIGDGIKPGMKIIFHARVVKYEKGYFGRKEDVFKSEGWDFRLDRPTKFEVLA